MAGKDELPSTLQRSPKKAQRTWSEAHDSAVQSYGEGERAHRTAYAALKHTHHKVGDHWEAKDEAGPSDSRAERGAADSGGESAGGVDANASKDELYRQARQLDVRAAPRCRRTSWWRRCARPANGRPLEPARSRSNPARCLPGHARRGR